MFADEDQAAKLLRDPVAPAQRSDEAMKKVQSRTLDDGTPVHSFQSLMATLQGIVRNTCGVPGGGADAPLSRSPPHPTLITMGFIGETRLF
jgi:hypothetical protein